MTCVKDSAVILASGYYIFLYDLQQNKWNMYSSCKFEAVDGIGCLAGCKDQNLFAFSEKCKGSRIFLINYPELRVVYKLKGE